MGMHWCLKDFHVRREVSELENHFFELATLHGDYRIPSIASFLHDKVIPQGRATPNDFHYTDRYLLACPKYYPPPDESEDEFWVESADASVLSPRSEHQQQQQQNRGDGSGPSSARE